MKKFKLLVEKIPIATVYYSFNSTYKSYQCSIVKNDLSDAIHDIFSKELNNPTENIIYLANRFGLENFEIEECQ